MAVGSYVTAKALLATREGGLRQRPYQAYVPHRLMEWEPVVSATVASALDAASRSLADIEMGHWNDLSASMARWVIARDESIKSSSIEGINASPAEMAWAQYRRQAGSAEPDEHAALSLGSVRQTDAAVELGRRMRDGRRCSIEDILGLHKALFIDTDQRDIAGAVRSDPMHIGPPNSTIDDATFIAPPPDSVPALLEDLAEYLNSDAHPAIIRAAIVHSQFETIHPFDDGNGRTGRALIHTVLNAAGVVDGAVPISSHLHSQHIRYYGALSVAQSVQCGMHDRERSESLVPWLTLFSEACVRARRETDQALNEMKLVVSRWRERAKFRSGSAAERLMRLLPSMPVLDSELVTERIGVSGHVARSALRSLADAGIVQHVGGQRNRRYEVPDLVRVIRSLDSASEAGAALRFPPPDAVMPDAVAPVPRAPERFQAPDALGPVLDPTRSRSAESPMMPHGQQCTHVGPRSKRRCTQTYGHRGQHRYD